jgi:hypothetical protein
VFLFSFQALHEFLYAERASVSRVKGLATGVVQLSPAPQQFLLVIDKRGENVLSEDVEERIPYNRISMANNHTDGA